MADGVAQESPIYQELLTALKNHGVDEDSLSSNIKHQLNLLVRYSPRQGTIACNKPELIVPLLNEDVLDHSPSKGELENHLQSFLDNEVDSELAIRKFHRSEIIRIAWRDLCELGEIDQITEELSDLADVVVQAVFNLVWERLIGEYGVPLDEDNNTPSHMCVIGLGKLGGRELNFSSDIDLLFVYQSDGETGGTPDASISNESFFTQLAQGICDILNKVTPEGFIYRVDTRLRPEGDRGALAVPLTAVEFYYQNYGQNWERQALLKARCVAGNEEVGEQFIKLVTPFTYRKYVDEVEIADVLRSIDLMRNKYLIRLSTPEAKAADFKNGYGGIRDIEFFVQAVQMLYGGQYPEIKLSGTLVSLLRMHESHLLHSKDYAMLVTAYRFLRRVEHRMQMVGELQVYDLPKDQARQDLLAESMGYKTYEEFERQYDKNRERVRQIYEGVFQREEWHDPSELILDSDTFNEECKQLLVEYEFKDPKRAFSFLKALNKSPDAHLQPKTTRLFKAFLPRLLLCLKNSPDSDMALAHFEQIISSFKARSALYESLCDQPPLLDLLVSVVCGSRFLTSLILRDPSLMDEIGRDQTFQEHVDKASLERHLRIMEKTYPSREHREHLLFVQNAAMFRSGIRFILGLSDVERMGDELTHIADFILEQSMLPVNDMLSKRFPDFAEKHADHIGILGLGKLGGGEFNVASDCDLIFVYSNLDASENISAGEYFQRWVTEYTRYLESKTFMGFLYHPDIRLRPHGQSGPLASSEFAFCEYFRKQAQFWEKMALSRARFICGNPKIEKTLERLKKETLFTVPCTHKEVESLLSMRQKIEREKSKEVLKAGPGGLVDVEFIAQALVIHYGPDYESVRSTSTLDVLRAAQQDKLLDEDDAKWLISSYLFLREVENRLRIVNNVSLDALPNNSQELEKLTRRYSLKLGTEKPTPDKFLGMISLHTHRVRTIYEKFFGDLLKSTS